MTALSTESFLLRLTDDARLAIYSHFILPPFHGCREYDGLLLSCRQLREEVICEAKRQLRIYLHEIEKDASLKSLKDLSAMTEEAETNQDPPRLQFLEPSTVLGKPVINVKVPFRLPPIEHDWHYQAYPVRGFCRAIVHTGRPESIWQRKARECDEQQEIYSKLTTQVLSPIGKLHKLHLASIDVELIVDEITATKIKEDSSLEQELKTREQSQQLGKNVLGRLLDSYINKLALKGYFNMNGWSEDWAFNVQAINTRWDFGTHKPVSQEDYFHAPWVRLYNGISEQVSCTPDRREGTSQVVFNARSIAQETLRDSKVHLEQSKKAQQMQNSNQFTRDRYEFWTARIANTREKLRRLGVPEKEEPGDST
ncbi:hypothetical protein N0V94_004498 [Neodidymelliopsis sp. IMI 364377]|nr:hypothetical protein N0V94_004498 [Neodidymelliopsis sp. IMI 364377]